VTLLKFRKLAGSRRSTSTPILIVHQTRWSRRWEVNVLEERLWHMVRTHANARMGPCTPTHKMRWTALARLPTSWRVEHQNTPFRHRLLLLLQHAVDSVATTGRRLAASSSGDDAFVRPPLPKLHAQCGRQRKSSNSVAGSRDAWLGAAMRGWEPRCVAENKRWAGNTEA
jgi:hypothetical protein